MSLDTLHSSSSLELTLLDSLARAELNLTLATVVRRYELDLSLTSREDVDFKRDHFVPSPDPKSKGFRVMVRTATD